MRFSLKAGLKFQLFAFAFLLTIACPAVAASLTIANAGFEDPTSLPSGQTDNFVPSWIGDTAVSGNFGVFRPGVFPLYFGGVAPQGLNVAFIQDGFLSQVLTDVVAANTTYTLTAQIGDSALDTISYTMQLLAGGVILAQTSTPLPADNTFTTVTLNYTALSGDPLLGQALEIRFLDLSAGQTSDVYVDSVTLDAVTSNAVPEPCAGGLLLSGLLCLIPLRRRHRALGA